MERARALVVDDDAVAASELCELLAHLDLVACSATSRAEALSLLARGNSYDILLTDLNMPHGGGIDLIRDIVDRPMFAPGICIGVFSGQPHVPDLAAAINLRIDFFVNKPFEFEKIRSALLRVVEEANARRKQKLSDRNSRVLNQPILTSYHDDTPRIVGKLIKRFGSVRKSVMELGLDDVKFRILLEVADGHFRQSYVPVSAVCGIDGTPYSTSVRKLNELEEASLVKRTVVFERPRRVNVTLTEKGLDVVHQALSKIIL